MKNTLWFLLFLAPVMSFGQNVLIEPTGISPSTTSAFVQKAYDDILDIPNPSKGEVYFDSTFNEVRVFDGSEWVRLLNSRAERISADFFSPETDGISPFTIRKLAVNSRNEFLIIGDMIGTAEFNSGNISSPNLTTGTSFLICLNQDLELKWSRQGFGSLLLYHLSIDANDNVIVTGEYIDYCNFGGRTSK